MRPAFMCVICVGPAYMVCVCTRSVWVCQLVSPAACTPVFTVSVPRFLWRLSSIFVRTEVFKSLTTRIFLDKEDIFSAGPR